MKNFFIGLFCGVVFAGLAAFIFLFAVIRLSTTERKPSVPESAALVMKLEGDLPEVPPLDVPLPFLESQTPSTIVETWRMLQRAGTDPHVKALVLEPRGLGVGWAKLEELRQDILTFKKTGKPVYAYLRGPGTREYYLASAADKIYLAPEDLLDVKGLRLEMMYLKGVFDKLGVKMEIEHVGKYKDGGDTYTRTSMSPETKEVYGKILDQLFGSLVSTIAEGRHKTPEQVTALMDEGPFLAPDAKANGLVDELAFEDKLYSDLNVATKLTLSKISHRQYSKANPPSGSGKRIALIAGSGEITRGEGNDAFGSQDGITAGGMVKLLKQVEADSSIDGVIFRVDSPGGDGIASDDILDAARSLSKKKPMVISMSDLAASGGYFISMTGDPIIAYPNTLTGSIGVFFGKISLRGLYDKVGLTKDGLSRGRYADINSEYKTLTDDERAKLRKELEAFYKGFVERVATGRKRPYDVVEPLAQGRVWMGSQAKQNGLIDELGGLDKALSMVKLKAKIGESEKVAIVPFPQKKTLWEVFTSRDETAMVDVLARVKLGQSPAEMAARKLLHSVPVRSLQSGGVLKLMPYVITVQ
ncbi:MAG: signal peptide peptidase SppA [Bryobacteraceae bacterium]